MNALELYTCKVMHRRLVKTPYRFSYRIFSLLIDIDRLDEVNNKSLLLSVNRFNLLSFSTKDHLPHSNLTLREWVNNALLTKNIDASELTIKILCMPRVLGWGFNPLSIWYCEDQLGNPIATICEVHNTFGERHCYILLPEQPEWPVKTTHAKSFHVSPFFDIKGHYEFILDKPASNLKIGIKLFDNMQCMLDATQNGKSIAPTTSNLIKQSLSIPFQTAKVLGAIHWQALKIWLRGNHFYRKPEPPSEEIS